MFSTGLSSGDFDGSGSKVMLFGVSKVFEKWMGATHFLTRSLGRVGTEMALHVLAYNLKRVINIIGVRPLIQAIQAA